MASQTGRGKAVDGRPEERAAADAAVEAVSDQGWISLATAAVATQDLAAAGVAFQELLRRRDSIERSYAAVTPPADWTAAKEEERDAALDPLLARLYQLACSMAALPAATPEQMRIKAMALTEFCEERSDDLVHRLASSLAADLLRV